MDDLLDAAPCGFFTFGHNGTIGLINTTLLTLLGQAPAALVGQPVETLLSPGSRIFFQSYFLSRLMLEGAVEEIYLQLQTADGTLIPVLTNGRSRTSDGAPIYCVVVVPVRQRSQYEQELLQARREAEAAGQAEARARLEAERANEARTSFLANMSHELRTPLNTVIALSEALRDQLYGPLNEPQDRAVRAISASGRHLLELINDILDLAKISSGKLELQRELILVKDVCEGSLSLLRHAAREKGLIVSLTLDPQVSWISADPLRLKQILVNLLSNAVKFTPPGGEVGLEVRAEPDGRLAFTVSDTGIGIAPEQMDRLFKPFVQLDGRLARQYEGTGLGLALVRMLTEIHGGTVSVFSSVGVGSSFTVSLPADQGALARSELAD